MRLGLILDLLRRPVWLAGLGMVIVSFLLDATALRFGHLASVQPILVLELPLTLVGASFVFRSAPLRRREWMAIVIMTAGLAALVFFLDPSSPRRPTISALTWAVGTGSTAAAIAACVAGSSRGGRNRRPALLGLAAGIAFGLTAAFMKTATGGLHHGPAGVFETWSTYAMVASGLTAMYLMQNALQAGSLVAAQPGITLADPGVAILWGVVAFGERIRGGAYMGGAVLAGLALASGVVIMTRSPLLRDQEEVLAGPGGGGPGQDEVDGPDGNLRGGKPTGATSSRDGGASDAGSRRGSAGSPPPTSPPASSPDRSPGATR
jgi:drug/metabolite transporter (DMT)-like permease